MRRLPGRIRRRLIRWRRDRAHIPSALGHALRDAHGPTMRPILGMPTSRGLDVIAEGADRYQQSFRASRLAQQ